MCGGTEDALRKAEPIRRSSVQTRALSAVLPKLQGESARQHGYEHQHRGSAEGLALGAALGLDWDMSRKVLLRQARRPRTGNRWRR